MAWTWEGQQDGPKGACYNYDGTDGFKLLDENGDVIFCAGSHWYNEMPDRDQCRLIASAPDLLKALEAIDTAAELHVGTSGYAYSYTMSDLAPALKQVRAAIEKAKGD